ncbi:MAG: GNAT family N-acetyltransferase, partial [Bacillota bacterium]|nr:GNAT family N-acetyltransferase [Bacillota bacterium]
LRDFIQSDIDDRLYWETIENEWQLWDAPWEYEGKEENELKRDLERYKNKMLLWATKQMSESNLRTGFQICINDDTRTYIGWCNSYNINENFEIIQTKGYSAIGINIPVMTARGKGFAASALVMFIHYLIKNGENEIYTQTWSGNKPMIGLAGKIGFEECRRKSNIHKVRGEIFDDLTFKLNMEKFYKFSDH